MPLPRKLLILVSVISLLAAIPATAARGPVKEPAVAGAFYPADRSELRKAVDRYLSQADSGKEEGKLLGLIVPHAGYQFSGGIAGHSYARLKGSGITTVILIGPSHRAPLRGAAVYAKGGMSTPLGTVPVNEKLAAALIDSRAGVNADPAPFAAEHSLEVQLPFLQRALGSFTIVPILIGNPTRESFASLEENLGKMLRDQPRTIIIASSDLSHYHDGTTAKQMDTRVIGEVERLAVGDLEQSILGGKGEMCGGFPVLITLAAVKRCGATHGVLFRQGDSGDVTGDKRQVVGYAAMGLYRSPLKPEQKRELISLAKATLAAHLQGKHLPTAGSSPRLRAAGASFVTLKDRRGNLRGCIGTTVALMPLYRSVITNAVAAASRDPRFPPVTMAELPGLTVEVTVLSPMEELKRITDIVIGKHGLLLEKGGASSVFLPQVPVEEGWDRAIYLEQLALKAGLPRDGWKGAKLSSFTAEIITDGR
jgi:AmmeMemoRadiSam system protein B/AmmeMemoRadiSam system protein A